MWMRFWSWTTTVIFDVPARVYAYTIMRLSQINVEVSALVDTVAVSGGTLVATESAATIMRASAINAEGSISAAPINCEAELL